MTNIQASHTLQFNQSQLQMLLSTQNKLRYSKHVVIIAVELLCTSPAAYRMLRRSRIIHLPMEQLIRDLTSRSFQDVNLPVIFIDLKSQQLLVNNIFDEVEINNKLRCTSGHIHGHADNKSDQLATSALCFEAVCHYGGPRFLLRLFPVANLDAKQLRIFFLKILSVIQKCGGGPVSVVCDNCPMNQVLYNDHGGPLAVGLLPGKSSWCMITCTYLRIL